MKTDSLPKFSIPIPCHENWNNMSITEKGKFCSICSKEVLDFTSVSKKDVQKIISERKDGTCGRVFKSQLSNDNESGENFFSGNFRFIRKIAASLLAVIGIKILSVTSANAQTIELKNPDENDLKKIGITTFVNDNDSTITIKGKIKEAVTKETIPFATVVIYVNDKLLTGVISDIDGNFVLKILKKNLNSYFDLAINYLGYKIMEVKNIPVNNKSFDMQIELQQSSLELKIIGAISFDNEINPYKNPNEKTFNQRDIKHMPH